MGFVESKSLNKGILGIDYNSLNLPREITIKNSSTVGKTYYTYAAFGVKLRAKHLSSFNMTIQPMHGITSADGIFDIIVTTDYAGNVIYEDGSLKRILIDGGYIEGNVYHFYLTDHLGNNRMVVKGDGTPVQTNHYYPFGMAFAETSTEELGKQPYRYNGKELEDKHGLNLMIMRLAIWSRPWAGLQPLTRWRRSIIRLVRMPILAIIR